MATSTKKIPFHEQLEICMDGRTNKWLADRTEIAQSEISRIINGVLTPSETQLSKIKSVFPEDLINY